MTRGLENKLHIDAQKNIEGIKQRFDKAELDIFPAYREQFAQYRESVLSLLENPENKGVVDDPSVIAAVEAGNRKVIAGLSNAAGKEARRRKRVVIQEASNDNFKTIKIAA